MRVLKDPFVQFLGLGTLIFLAYSFSQSAEQPDVERRIAIDGPTQNWIYSNFEKQFRRAPSRLEMGALIRSHVEQEVKYREALSLGLDERDIIVRRRMMQKFDFLFGNAAAGMVPEDEVLREWTETHHEEFTLPETISFEHLWFSPDRRKSRTEADAAAALAALRAGRQETGDPFPFEVVFEGAIPAEVRSVLGAQFAGAVFRAPVGVWSGPIASGLGIHLVLVTDRTGPSPPPFEEIRDAVLAQWREEKSEEILAEMVAKLKADYEVEIDEESLMRFDYSPDAAAEPR